MKYDSVLAYHQSVTDEKDDRLEDADWRVREAYDATLELMFKRLDGSKLHFIKCKDKNISALE